MNEQVSNIYLNGEPMVWITIEPNTDGDLEVGLGDSVSGDGLFPLSEYNRHKECGTIPYEWWTGLSREEAHELTPHVSDTQFNNFHDIWFNEIYGENGERL